MFSFFGQKAIPLILFVLVVVFLGFRFMWFQEPKPEGVLLSVGGHLLKMHIADSPEELEKGLSGVAHLGENEGMLFVIPEGMRPAFHMRDVKVPMSIAFLDQKGMILGFKEMDLKERDRSYSSPDGTRYALEVRQGWFQRRGIKRGDLVHPSFSPLSPREKTL